MSSMTGTVSYIATGDPLFDYLTGGPIAIAKSDGAVLWLNSWIPPEEQIAALSKGRAYLDLDPVELLTRATLMLDYLQKSIPQPITFRRVDGQQQIVESPRLVVYPWNSVEYYETKDPFTMLLSGPIAVPRNGDEPFVMGTARPYEQNIEQYHRKEEGNGMRVRI
jgi:hypothetical protein